MTNSSHSERVQASGVVGHSYDTDDQIEDLDIYEALVNPHEGAGGSKKGGAGGPGMMPPPMGGAGGSSGKAGTAAGAAAGSTVAPRGTAAAGAGTGASGVGAPGFAGSGAGSDGLSGLSTSGTGGLAGLSSGGLGSSAASNFSMPRIGTSAAGVTDPSTTGSDLPSYTGTTPGSGGYTLPSPGTGTGTSPTIPSFPGTGSGTGTGTGNLPTVPTPSAGIKPPSTSGLGGAGGGGVPTTGGGGGGAGAPGTGSLAVAPVQASPEMLHKEAQHWDDTAGQFTGAVSDPVQALAPTSVDFGMMVDAFPSYSDLLNRMKTWSIQAGAEFTSISEALQSASGNYQDTEDTNASATTSIPSGGPVVAV